MTYDTYRFIFIGAAILCGIMLVTSVLVFIFMKIPKVISDLSGATARKAIKNMRERNEATGDKGYKVSAYNEARGKLTDKISASGNLIQYQQMQMRGIDTSKISTQELDGGDHTTLLDTYVPSDSGAGETSVLAEPVHYGETAVLSEAMANPVFVVEYEITYIHTDEIISQEIFQ